MNLIYMIDWVYSRADLISLKLVFEALHVQTPQLSGKQLIV